MVCRLQHILLYPVPCTLNPTFHVLLHSPHAAAKALVRDHTLQVEQQEGERQVLVEGVFDEASQAVDRQTAVHHQQAHQEAATEAGSRIKLRSKGSVAVSCRQESAETIMYPPHEWGAPCVD